MELEREKNDVLIIAHETVLRCLYAYFFDLPESVSPMAYGSADITQFIY